MLPEETDAPSLARLLPKTSILIRQIESSSLDTLFREIEEYDIHDLAETSIYLKRALNETRRWLGAEPAYLE